MLVLHAPDLSIPSLLCPLDFVPVSSSCLPFDDRSVSYMSSTSGVRTLHDPLQTTPLHLLRSQDPARCALQTWARQFDTLN